MGRRAIRLARLAACACLLSAALAGDKDVANFLCEKGEKALRAKDYVEAVDSFRRALAEYSPLPEAAYGLGQALEEQDQATEAISAYQQCLEQIGKEPPRQWRALRYKAAKAVSRLRRRFADLDKLNRGFIKECLAFGRKSAKSSPRWARRAFEAVLALDPANPEAKRRLAKLPPAGSAPAGGSSKRKGKGTGGGEWSPLVESNRLSNWDPGTRNGKWECNRGVITGQGREKLGELNWLDTRHFAGKYSIRVRCKVERGDAAIYGVFVGDGKATWWAVIMDQNKAIVLERFEGGSQSRATSAYLPEDFDRTEWHTLLIEIDDDACRVSVNGKQMFEHSGGARFFGKVCLFVQNCKTSFKDLETKRE